MYEADEEIEYQDTSEQNPLTDWVNEPTCLDLKQNLQDATPHHDLQVNKVNEWLDQLNATGAATVTKAKGRSTVVPKLIRKQAEWRYASLSEAFLSDRDIFDADPQTYEDTDAAYQAGVILNHQFNNQIGKVPFIDEYVRTAVDEGTAIVRVGWHYEEEEQEVVKERLVPITDQEELAMMQETITFANAAPQNIMQLPDRMRRSVEASLQNKRFVQYVPNGKEKKMVATVNQPTLDVCDYNNVIIDPTCKGNLKKANFIIYRFETSLSDLEKTNLYSDLDKIDTEKTAIQNEATYRQEDTGSFNFEDKPRKKFWAYEYWGYWDIHNTGRTVPIVATWVGDTMIRMEESPYPDQGLPFVSAQYLPKRKHVFGEPDGELLKENQQIVGAITRGLIDSMGRSAAGQTGIKKDALDVVNRRRFDRGEDYMFNPHVNPSESVYHHTYPEIPQSAPFMINLQHQEAESLTGIKAFHHGITGDGLGQSATAARSAIDAAGKRENGILRRLADGVIEIGYKILAMNAEFLDEEEIIRVSSEEFVRVRRDDLSGRIDIRLTISTVESDNVKAQELAFMLQTMGNTMDPAMSQMILADIARLRKMPELAHAIKTYQPEPDPVEQKIKELQVAELEAKIRKLESEALENQAEADLDSAKADEARAKRDQMDLDFIEQDEGIKHERNLEQDRAQGEMNLERDMINNALTQQGGNGTANTNP